MTIDFQITSQSIELPVGSESISAYLARPQSAGKYPGVVILQEVFGINEHIRDTVDRMARMGYVVIAPALFDRFAPNFASGYSQAELELGRSYVAQTSATQLLIDIQAAIDYLKSLPEVIPRFGCVGFCFGGHVAYLAATLPDIAVTASFYGRGIPHFTFGEGAPSIERTADIHGEIYLFFGDLDLSIPPADIIAIKAALVRHRICYQIWQYADAEHGFNCDRRSSYNPIAANDARSHVGELLAKLRIKN